MDIERVQTGIRIEKRLLEQAEAIRKLNETLRGFRVLSGAEVNIRKDGSLDVANAAQIVRNASALAEALAGHGLRLVSGGTDNHLMLVDLRTFDADLSGKKARLALDKAGISLNENTVPDDPRPPYITSGLRIGTPAVTTQGMGEAEMATIGDLIPPSERGRWQGLTGAVFGFASVIGPTTGGWISDHADWRWVFFVSLPVGFIALAVVAATLKIPPHPDRGTKVDYAGAGLLAFGLSSGLLAIVQGGPFELYAVSALVLAVFVWWEMRVDQPIVPVELMNFRLE